MGAFNVISNYKEPSDYKLHNNILLDLGTIIYIFNNQVRFISQIEPTLDHIYVGLYIEEIVGFSIATVTINNPKGKKKILLTRAAYVLSFYTNLVCI